MLQLTLGQATMEEWGWRIPFLIAGPLGLIAIYFRSKIEESPQFQATLDAQEEIAKNATDGDAAAVPRARWESSRPTGAPSSWP